jgi:hypothetical protein
VKLPIVTTSETKSIRGCERRHFYRYVLGYRPISTPRALAFGTVSHAGLEAWWATAGDFKAASAALVDAHRESELDGYDLIKADVMLLGYHARWHNEDVKVLGVEQEFLVPIVHPDRKTTHVVQLAGKLDALCEIDGKVFIPEHKTKASSVADGSYWEALRGDVQVSNYIIAAQSLGYDCQSVLYDVLVKPEDPLKATPQEKRKYKKGTGELYANQRAEDEGPETYRARITALIEENPDKYYQRAVIGRMPHELEESQRDLWDAAERILAAHTRAYHPRNTDACHQYNRQCAYFEVCFGGVDIEDPIRFEKTEAHPELTITGENDNAASNAAE